MNLRQRTGRTNVASEDKWQSVVSKSVETGAKSKSISSKGRLSNSVQFISVHARSFKDYYLTNMLTFRLCYCKQ